MVPHVLAVLSLAAQRWTASSPAAKSALDGPVVDSQVDGSLTATSALEKSAATVDGMAVALYIAAAALHSTAAVSDKVAAAPAAEVST